MQDMDDKQRKAVLGEVLMDELKAIREGIDALRHLPAQVQSIDKRLSDVEIDVKAIKVVVTEHSKQLRLHSKQLQTQSKQLTQLLN